MSEQSRIEWTDATWNPVTGCTKVSPGCAHCYAERMALRLQKMGAPGYEHGFQVCIHQDRLELPLHWKRPHMIFVCSMGDLFHEAVSISEIRHIFSVMKQAHWHTFQVLTKRASRAAHLSCDLEWSSNIWMGVSVESGDHMWRMEELHETAAVVKFVSFEPLLGPLPKLDLRGIDWVIVGGESGPEARPMLTEWVVEIRDQCVEAGVPFFFKQWGGPQRKRAGHLLDGRIWHEMPKRSRP